MKLIVHFTAEAGFYAMRYVETLAARIVKREEMNSEIMENRGKIKDHYSTRYSTARYGNIFFEIK